MRPFGWQVIGIGAMVTLLCALSVGNPDPGVDAAAGFDPATGVDTATERSAATERSGPATPSISPSRLDYVVMASLANTAALGIPRSASFATVTVDANPDVTTAPSVAAPANIAALDAATGHASGAHAALLKNSRAAPEM